MRASSRPSSAGHRARSRSCCTTRSATPPAGSSAPYTVSRAQLAAHLDQLTELASTTSRSGSCWTARRGRPLPPTHGGDHLRRRLRRLRRERLAELTERGLAATLYVTAGTLGGRSEWLAPLGAGGCRC